MMHGRLLKLHLSGSSTQSPGNFGFLQVNGTASADAIRDVFASGVNPTCYSSGEVTTKPGGANAIRQGINVRFDIFDGPYNSEKNNALYAPAQNVRKGYTHTGNACNAAPESDLSQAMGFPENGGLRLDGVTAVDGAMVGPVLGIPGAEIGEGDWNLDDYWAINHPLTPLNSTVLAELLAISDFDYDSFGVSHPGAKMPSRYDVYRYEIEKDAELDPVAGPLSDLSPGGEQGNPQCSGATPSTTEDRRVMFAAIVNCNSDEVIDEGGGVNTYPVEAYASFFMVNPMPQGSPATINIEVIDITGDGGNGTLDEFVRDEPVLVR
jgi:hypothetical protein